MGNLASGNVGLRVSVARRVPDESPRDFAGSMRLPKFENVGVRTGVGKPDGGVAIAREVARAARDGVPIDATMRAKFETLQRGSGVLYGDCGAIWVMLLHAKPTAPEMNLARPSLETMLKKHPDGFPALTWVLPSAGFSMDSDARHAAAEVTKAFDAALLVQATLIEGTGFQAAAVRAIVSGLDLMARSRAPKKTFAELAPTVAWCVGFRPPRDRDAAAATDIVETLSAVRQAIERGGELPG